jgi:cytochrome c553
MSKFLKIAAAAFCLPFVLNVAAAGDKDARVIAQAPAVSVKAGNIRLGRPATNEEIAAWDIDVRPDGVGLPEGMGSVAEGEAIFAERCAVCHGDFGEGRDRWPVLAGGFDTLKAERPVKTIGSYWPYLSTVYDYVRRAMPFGDARSLSDDDVYALTAYLLYLNDVVTDEGFVLSKDNFTAIRLANEPNFVPDDRDQEAHNKAGAELCMQNCKPDPAKVVMRARVLDVTPEGDGDGKSSVD